MALICPRCLARIEAKDLVCFCMLHDFRPDPDHLHAGCNLCREKEALDVGTFVSHVGCKSPNPFTEGLSAGFPRAARAHSGPETADRAEDEPAINPDGETLGDQALRVSHWELAMLARAAKLHSNRREMWFPY